MLNVNGFGHELKNYIAHCIFYKSHTLSTILLLGKIIVYLILTAKAKFNTKPFNYIHYRLLSSLRIPHDNNNKFIYCDFIYLFKFKKG